MHQTCVSNVPTNVIAIPMSANPLLMVHGGGLGTRLINCMVEFATVRSFSFLTFITLALPSFPYCSLAICNAVRKMFTFGSRRACVLDCIQNISQSEILSPHCLTSLIGASLSEPHTSGTSLQKCVCNVLVCLWPYTVNFKGAFKYFPKIEQCT